MEDPRRFAEEWNRVTQTYQPDFSDLDESIQGLLLRARPDTRAGNLPEGSSLREKNKT